MHIGRIVDLSHEIVPGEEEYKLEMDTHFVDDLLPDYKGKRAPGDWYIMQEISMWDHVGTHIESPLHYIEGGTDVSRLSLERLIGEAVVLDFRHKGFGEPIDLDEMKRAGEDVIREGDIVFIRTDLSKYYNTEHSHDRPYLTNDAVKWLVAKKISCLGVDCSGIENRGEMVQPNHGTLFEAGIPLIEHLNNLSDLSKSRFQVFILPYKVRGAAAFPVRVIAIEEE
ncbi:MAG: cyclase family protein [Armatimonadetes bacterium]|nr:cyclase family protein [Armatimonadota bacterium]